MVQTVIQKWGNSQAVRLPKAILNAANLSVNDPVAIDVHDNMITLRRLPARRTLDDLFAGYDGDYVPSEYDTGADVGREVFN